MPTPVSTKISLTWGGGANRIPACLKISNQPPAHNVVSRSPVMKVLNVITHGLPI